MRKGEGTPTARRPPPPDNLPRTAETGETPSRFLLAPFSNGAKRFLLDEKEREGTEKQEPAPPLCPILLQLRYTSRPPRPPGG